MNDDRHRTIRHWGWAWLALTASLALHVADEATHDFLSVYNRSVGVIRGRLPLLPLPTFSFAEWLTGLVLAVVVLALLSILAFRGEIRLRYLAYPYGVLMILNGLGHAASSLYFRRLMPGVISSPLLIVASLILLRATGRATHAG